MQSNTKIGIDVFAKFIENIKRIGLRFFHFSAKKIYIFI